MQGLLFSLILSLSIILAGCGFHLRGYYDIPEALRLLRVVPNQPFDAFQQTLKDTLKANGICIIDDCHTLANKAATLNILNQQFTERPSAYGSDGQANLALVQFTITYQISGPHFETPPSSIQVERELILNPNAILGTEDLRAKLHIELYNQATSQLMQELTYLSFHKS